MSSMRHGSSILALLVAGALALGACGGDDEGNGGTAATAPETGTTDTGTTETGTTETGTTTRERTGTTREDRTTTRERGDDSGGRGRGRSGRDGGSGGGSGGNSGGGSQRQRADIYRVARTVCNDFLPLQISRQLEQGDTSPEEVARNYSRGFPERQRRRAYAGCLAGIRARG